MLDPTITDLRRRLDNLFRLGTIAEVDYPNAKVRVFTVSGLMIIAIVIPQTGKTYCHFYCHSYVLLKSSEICVDHKK